MRNAPRREDRLRPILHRLDRAARDLNPILIVLAVGLALLYTSVYLALRLSPAPRHQSSAIIHTLPSITTVPPSTATGAG
jgi:hypothetical protein